MPLRNNFFIDTSVMQRIWIGAQDYTIQKLARFRVKISLYSVGAEVPSLVS